MLRFLNKFLLTLCAFIIFSCGFMDLRPIGLKIEPAKQDSLLNDAHSPVIIKFDTKMIKNETEGILQVSSDSGSMKGDLFWKGNHLYFVPVPGWTAGVRYTLSLLGSLRSTDGRELRIEKFISFYAINKNERPVLQIHYPDNGASISANDVSLELYFSSSMDRLSVESAFTFEGVGNKTFNWEADDKILIISADKPLSPWTSYRWTLRDSAKSTDGVPLPKTYSGYFTTDIDQTLPQVVNVFPVLNYNGSWYPTGSDFETGLASSHGAAVEFNKPMGENALRSVRFEPSLSGRIEFLDEKSIVYIFTKDPEPETTYTLIVAADTKDSEGLKLGADYKVNFIPDIPYFNVLSIFIDGTSHALEVNSSNIVLPVKINPGTGEIIFSVRFSLPFSTEEKQNIAQRITLSPFFPRTLAPIALQFINWFSDDSFYMCWEGLSAGSSETPHYYKLTIPGGKGGINNGMGSFMKEDLTIYLEAVNED